MSALSISLKIFRAIFISLWLLILLLCLAIWIGSPWMARYGLNEALTPYGLQLSEDSQLRYNPFMSRLTIHDLELLTGQGGKHFSISSAELELNLHRLLTRKIHIAAFQFQDVTIDVVIEPERTVVAGVDLTAIAQPQATEPNTPESASEPEPSSLPDLTLVMPEMGFRNFRLNLNHMGNAYSLTLEDLVLNGFQASNLQQQGDLEIHGHINDAEFSLATKLNLADQVGELEVSFGLYDFDLATLTPLVEEDLQRLAGEISLSMDVNVDLNGEQMAVKAPNIGLKLNNLVLEQQPFILESEQQSLFLKEVEASTTPEGQWQASLQLAYRSMAGLLALSSPNNQLASWSELSVSNSQLSVTDQFNLQIPGISFQNLNLMGQIPDDEYPVLPANIGQLAITDIHLTDNGVRVNKVHLQDLEANVLMQESGELANLADLQALEDTPESEAIPDEQAQTNPSANEPPEEDIAFGVQVDQIEIAEGSQILVRDNSVTPEFQENFLINRFTLGPVSLLQPEVKTWFDFDIKAGKYSQIVTSGFVQPFGEKLTADAVLEVSEYSLPTASSYLKQSLGIELVTGQLNSNLDLAIVDDQLDGETEIQVTGLKMGNTDNFEEDNGGDAVGGTVGEGTALTLNQALKTLKDKQDNLKLKVPIKGDISDPSFGLGNFTALILKKAAMRKTKSFLIDLFVPYSRVVKVTLGGAGLLLKVRYEPLVFSAGQQELNGQQQEYLGQLAVLLKDKPKLSIKTCAIVVPQDLGYAGELSEAQIKQLIEVGNVREDLVKTYLIDQGIDSERVLYCIPEVDREEGAQPEIKIKS